MDLLKAFLVKTIINPFEVSLDDPALNPHTLMTAIITLKHMKKDPLFKEATLLMAAIDVGCLELVRYLIEDGADVNQGSLMDGSGPLPWALINEQYGIARVLIKSGADVKSPNSEGFTPMYYAINKDSPTFIVQDFIDHGVAADAPICVNGLNDEEGLVPIVKAIKFHNIPVVKFFLEQSVPINFCYPAVKMCNSGKMSALTLAVGFNSIESVKLLIDHGANINGYDDEYPTPLHGSVFNEDVRYIRALINAGADIHKVHNLTKVIYMKEITNEIDLTALQLAALLQRCDAVKELLNAGAGVNKATMVTKRTPLHLACALVSAVASQRTMVKLLLDNGANMYIRDKNYCSPVLYCLYHQRFNLIEEFLYAGLDVNAYIGELGSLLLYSTVNAVPNVVKLCLAYGGDSKCRFKQGHTAFEVAITSGLCMVNVFLPYYPVDGVFANHCHSLRNLPMFKNQFLYFDGIKRNKEGMVITALQNGAEPRAFLTNMRFPIFRPVASKNSVMLRVLLNRGVCPNVQNNKKETPLHVAARKGFAEGCCDLLKHGACYNIKSSAGQSPLKVAVRGEVTRLLKDIVILFHKVKKDDVNSIKFTLKHMPNAVFFSSINCVNCRGNTLMQEAILSGSLQVAETIMALRLTRANQVPR